VTAFYTSVVVTLILVAAILWAAKKRPPGTRLSWGEAFVAALFGLACCS